MAVPLINGVQHAWASISINMLGRTITGIFSIEYGDERTIEDHLGAGDEPVMRGSGSKKYKDTGLGLYQFEVVAIQQAIGGDITNVPPFDITVAYKATLNSPVVVDVVQNCQFKNNERNLKSGDTKSEVKLNLATAGIKWHSI